MNISDEDIIKTLRAIRSLDDTFDSDHRRLFEASSRILAAMVSQPDAKISITGEHLGLQQVKTAVALADTLIYVLNERA